VSMRITIGLSAVAARHKTLDFTSDLADLVCNLVKRLCAPYRPELHYMRGPGPKWREKHARSVRLAIS
jgi:hypothetical protein